MFSKILSNRLRCTIAQLQAEVDVIKEFMALLPKSDHGKFCSILTLKCGRIAFLKEKLSILSKG